MKIPEVQVEHVRRRLGRIQPHGAGDRLAELGAVRLRDQRHRQSMDFTLQDAPHQVYAADYIAPLIAAANL